MADNSGSIGEESMKRAKAYADAMKRAEESLERQKKITKIIGNDLFGIDENAFFRNLSEGEYAAKTQEFSQAINKATMEARAEAAKLDDTFSKMFAKKSKGSKEFSEKFIKDLKLAGVDTKKLNSLFDKEGKLVGSISETMKDLGPEAFKFEEQLNKTLKPTKKMQEGINKSKETIQQLNDSIEMTNDALERAKKPTFSLAAGFNHIGQNIAKGIMPKLKEFDVAIKKAQIDTGINFTENAAQMSLLTSDTARFGLSIGDTTELMGALGSELRTANFSVLKEAAGDLAAMQKATGLTGAETGKLAKEFMLFGQSAKDVADYSADVMNQARVYGVSGKEIMGDIAANLSRMRTMGFVGGEQSLARMALEAKRLGMSVDSIFNVAERARTIEGSMEMAAELQLAGGSFAQIDPMQLLSAARTGPEELQKILGQMGSDVGAWVKDKNGKEEFQFDPIDRDRLKMVADATSMELGELQTMIAKNAEDVRKADLFGGLGGSLDGLTEEQKAFIMNATKIGKDGKLELAAKIDGVSDMNDLAKMNKTSIDALIDAEVKKKESLEEQAEQNMTFDESLTAFKESFMNIFTLLHYPLQKLTEGLQWVTSTLGGFGKAMVLGAVVFGAIIFNSAKAIIQGINMAKGFMLALKGGGFYSGIKQTFKDVGSNVKSIFSFGKKGKGDGSPDLAKNLSKTASDGDKAGSASRGSGDGLKGLAKGLTSMAGKKIPDGIKNTKSAAPALLFMLAGIPTLLTLGVLIGPLKGMVVRGFEAIASGMNAMSKIKEPRKAAGTMALIGLSLIPFAYALQMMTDVSWTAVVAGLGFLLISAGIIMALGFLMKTGAGAVAILAGAFAMIAIAGAILIFAVALNAMVPAAEALSQVGFGWLFEMGMALLGAAPGLLLGGIALLIAAPAILAGSFMLGLATDPLMKIAQTDWSGMASFADSLFLLGPAMLAFAASGLLLFNPLMLLGMVTMLAAIGTLGSIMQSLGPNLEQGASGIERMAEGVIKLEQAVSNLDTEKLSSLRNLAFSFATGGAGMGKMVAALSGGGEGGSERKVVHVVQLQLDGKMLKEIELRDNKHRT
jgi:hypothetical protein